MKLVLEIKPHMDDGRVVYRVVERFPVTIGRGFDNDVIVPDPYVDAHHLKIEAAEEGLIVSDLSGSHNLVVNGVQQGAGRLRVSAGSILQIGHTEIGLYAPDHPVPAALPLQKDNIVFSWVSHPLNVAACFFLALAVTLGWSWLEIWAEETGMVVAAAVAGTMAIVVLWSALWSVAGRLARHKSNFRSHAALISLYLIAGTLAWYVETYVDFLSNENWFADLVSYGLNFILFAFLLYGSLTLATLMSRRGRVLSALFFAGGVIAGIFILSLVSAKSFNQQPLYPATLKPYLSQFAPADTIEQFMAENENIFSSEEFTADAVPEKPVK